MDIYVISSGVDHEGQAVIGVATTLEGAQRQGGSEAPWTEWTEVTRDPSVRTWKREHRDRYQIVELFQHVS